MSRIEILFVLLNVETFPFKNIYLYYSYILGSSKHEIVNHCAVYFSEAAVKKTVIDDFEHDWMCDSVVPYVGKSKLLKFDMCIYSIRAK